MPKAIVPAPNPQSRRRFLRRLAVVSTGVLLPAAAVSAQAPPPAPQTVPQTEGGGGPEGTWVDLGPVTGFAADTVTQVTLPDTHPDAEVFVLPQAAPGEYIVLSGRCTHRGCLVRWEAQRRLFICPCHGGVYDASGKNVGGPPPRPLSALPVQISASGILQIQLAGA